MMYQHASWYYKIIWPVTCMFFVWLCCTYGTNTCLTSAWHCTNFFYICSCTRKTMQAHVQFHLLDRTCLINSCSFGSWQCFVHWQVKLQAHNTTAHGKVYRNAFHCTRRILVEEGVSPFLLSYFSLKISCLVLGS